MIHSEREQLRHWMGRTWVAEGKLDKLEREIEKLERDRATLIVCLRAIEQSVDQALHDATARGTL